MSFLMIDCVCLVLVDSFELRVGADDGPLLDLTMMLGEAGVVCLVCYASYPCRLMLLLS